jgi:choline dehydrogenase-like flavoprotein
MDVLTAVVRALLPEEVLQHRPAEVVASRVWQLIQANPNGTLRDEFERLLRLLNTRLGGLLLTGKAKPFQHHSIQPAEAVLTRMANSRNPARRQAFQALKRLIMLVVYGDTMDGEPNPLWSELGYPCVPIPEQTDDIRTWQPLALTGNQHLQADYIIVGSGAGGSVVAEALSERGFDVLVLEKGYDCPASRSGLNELAGFKRYFLNQGVLATRDLSVAILAGCAVGGGTTVNWTTCIRAPDSVIEEWRSEYRLSEWNCDLFDRLYSEVEQEIGVTGQVDVPNRPNALLAQGCERMGLDVKPTKRNVKNCNERCGPCMFGCPHGAKQSTPRTYLERAAKHGMRLLARANARQIISGDRVEGPYVGSDGKTYSLTAKAGRGIVVAAGALETPALLMRSLSHPQLGKNLRLHPTAVVIGMYADPVEPWRGAPQSVYSDTLLDMDGRGYGVLLETPALYPGMAASALPWQGREDHWNLLKRLRHSAAFIAIARDCGTGRVKLGRDGEPVFEYGLDKKSAKHLIQGMIMLLKMHFAAGALEAGMIHQSPLRFTREAFVDMEAGDMNLFRNLLDYAPGRLPLYSAHQMGTCRASGDPRLGVTDPIGKVWGTQNLYIADASLFPTAVGVNPMLTVMAVAKWVAAHIP